MDLFREFEALVAALESAQLEYAVCGGLALAVHGLPRATRDIDLLVRPEDLPRLKEVVHTLGFDLEAAPMHFAESGLDLKRASKVAGEDLLMLDLLLVNPRIEIAWRSRTRIPWLSGEIWVVSRDALISLKLAAGRPQDLADIARLKGGS